ncbi:MAG: ATP synthase F1 subunit gamma [Mariprofundales bacterium]
MASAKEIRGQIKAIQNTAKITKAMQMVAAAKMKKAQDKVIDARAYREGIRRIAANLMQSHPEYHHPFLTPRQQVKKVAFVLIATDKGLCGSLNVNLFRAMLVKLRDFDGIDTDVIAIGRRGALFGRRVSNLTASAEQIPDAPELADITGVLATAMNGYTDGIYDEIYLVGNDFVNTMTQNPNVELLLPCPELEAQHSGHWDYLYEPDSKEVLDGLLRHYVESLAYHAVLENKACEQSARMVAMKSATDNANDIVKDLRISYNKARQAAITMELAEIVSGAAATQ